MLKSWVQLVGLAGFSAMFSTFLVRLGLRLISVSLSWVFLDWMSVTPFSFFHCVSAASFFSNSSALSLSCCFSTLTSASFGISLSQYPIRNSQFFILGVYFFGLILTICTSLSCLSLSLSSQSFFFSSLSFLFRTQSFSLATHSACLMYCDCLLCSSNFRQYSSQTVSALSQSWLISSWISRFFFSLSSRNSCLPFSVSSFRITLAFFIWSNFYLVSLTEARITLSLLLTSSQLSLKGFFSLQSWSLWWNSSVLLSLSLVLWISISSKETALTSCFLICSISWFICFSSFGKRDTVIRSLFRWFSLAWSDSLLLLPSPSRDFSWVSVSSSSSATFWILPFLALISFRIFDFC